MRRVVLALALLACSDSLSVPDSPLGALAIGPEGGCRGGDCPDVAVSPQGHVRLLATAPPEKPALVVASNNSDSAVVQSAKPTCSAKCEYVVEVDTKAPGVADITFSNPDGTLVDLARLQVR